MSDFTGKQESFLTTQVANIVFFPALSMGDFQRDYRIPSDYLDSMVVNEVKIAMLEINKQLNDQRLEWLAAGYTELKFVVPIETIGSGDSAKNTKETFYIRAVFCRAKAQLLKQFPTVNRRENAQNEAKESEATESYFFGESQNALKSLLGKTRVTAVMI